MRSFWLTLFLIPLLLLASGCKRRNRTSGTLRASTVFAGDPGVESHFAKGFYGVESGSWRWTAKDFAVDLSPPRHSDQKGAELVVKLAVPDAVIQKLGSVQLSSSIQGAPLAPETYSKPGSYTYTRDVSSDKLQNETVRIEFDLDHTLGPTDTDRRQLGIIVSQVGLVPK